MFGKSDKENLNEYISNNHLESISQQYGNLISEIKKSTASFGGFDNGTVSCLNALLKQNWIIISQLERLNYNMEKLQQK